MGNYRVGTGGEVIAKSERTSTRCARYFFQAAERPRVSRETLKDSPRAKGSCGRWWSTL